MTLDERPTPQDRHLRPVHLDEPPDDPYADNPPQPTDVHPDGRTPITDQAAERALLGSLLAAPDLGRTLATHVTPDDFWTPTHAELWTTWHHLATDLPDNQGPDPVTLGAHATATKNADLARLIADLWLNDKACPNPLAGDHYARIVRDTARLRAVDQVATGLHQIANRGTADQVGPYLEEALQRLDDAATRYGPATATDLGHQAGLHDLSWVDGGRPPEIPPPAWTHRADGIALFYPGKVNGLFGDPAAAKTWLAQTAIVEALNDPSGTGTAAMIDVDHNGPDHTAARLLLLGARPADIANPERFRYYEPEDAEQLKTAVADVTRRAPSIVVIDSLGEIVPMLGGSSNDGDEMTTALRLVCTPPATAGSCVITIDHLPKSTETRASGYAIGSIAKKRMIRGSYIRCETRTQPAPGRIGKITLRLEKDTSGELEKHCPGRLIGTFTLDSTFSTNDPAAGGQHPVTTWSIDQDTVAPVDRDGTFRPTIVMERVSRYVEDNDQCGLTEIRKAVGGKGQIVDEAISILVREGYFSVIDNGAGKKSPHHSNVAYRQDEDEHLDRRN